MTFLKVIEIWTPSSDGQSLTLFDGYFGKYEKFKQETIDHKFIFDLGLPGKAWSTAQPQIITDIAHSYFQRKKSAVQIGITSGIAIPVFSGEFLMAVVIFLFGSDDNSEGAVELWANESRQSTKISLIDGYYGQLGNLEQTSRNLQFARGQGLPGMTWDYQLPMLITDPAKSPLFIRTQNAAIDNITTAVGIPFKNKNRDYVISFLSTNGTPIAKRFEIWLPSKDHDYLFLSSAKCTQDNDLFNRLGYKKIRRGDGLKGRVWLTGCPAISEDLVTDELVQFNSKDEFKVGMVMPMIENGFLNSLIIFIF